MRKHKENICSFVSRAPQGARGLKFKVGEDVMSETESRPARGAWIEINGGQRERILYQSRPARGAWIEISDYCSC